MASTSVTVIIIVDPDFGARLDASAMRGPVWIADTPVNRPAAELWWRTHPDSKPEAVTTFRVTPGAPPDQWCLDIIPIVDMHFGAFDDRLPTYNAVEISGTKPTPALIALLAESGYDQISDLEGGFRAGRGARTA